MTKKLRISIGPNRHQMEIAHVNDSSRPTIINSEFFVGRVLVKIRDFSGITPDGSQPIKDHVYFDGRSRKFDIQIEGRFKKRNGVQLYSGEEIHFGSDFDHLVDFPKSAFNAGMRVARWIDPNVFYDLSPPSSRPFIMSPYLACMNTLCAWPCPQRLSDALVCLRQPDRDDDDHLNHHHHLNQNQNQIQIQNQNQIDDIVPIEQVNQDQIGNTLGKKKIARHVRRYWRFIGLKNDLGRIDAFLIKNSNLLTHPTSKLINSQSYQSHQLNHINSNQTLHNNLNQFQSHHSNQFNHNDQDLDDAYSCHAPSSHATFATAIDSFNEPKTNQSSPSSFHFSPRIFPRHQISFGAGLRDTYQDQQTEANEREGEARAQRMIELIGQDDSLPPPLAPSIPSNSLESQSEINQIDQKKSNKVKHSLKKLKTALKKITPNLSSSNSSTSNPQITFSPNKKHYSTALNGLGPRQSRSSGLINLPRLPNTVNRASSRKLPLVGNRDSSPNLRNKLKSNHALERRASMMPRPLSHHPPSSNPILELESLNTKLRSTSLDHNRLSSTLNTSPPSFKTSSNLNSNLHTISQTIENQIENINSPSNSNISTIIKSDKESIRASSPSTYHSHSNKTSLTSTSEQHQESHSIISNSHHHHHHHHQTLKHDLTKPQGESSNLTLVLNNSNQSENQIISSSPLIPSNHQIDKLEQVTSLSDQSSTPIAITPLSSTPPGDGTIIIEDSQSIQSSNLANSSQPSLLQPITPKGPSQKEIDEAPELEDVEEGDLMFAHMLNLPEDLTNFDSVKDQLGPWRFKNQTTDILEDNTFVFLNKSVNVQKRRKHFSEGNGKHRKSFTYDPDIVYATSFFSPFMDFNTFDLAIGPVKINVAKILGDMPVRYTLKSTRIDPNSPNQEEEIFVTIAFELVD
ncbi:hypothetical protein O181_077112 [Austropuccinia psidii MF-1]|uniref:Domain of unknown function at the cortex 1 domain-containing protein n=1 Tax=Austropuccinia psidii MF-1 TaxID=1389203 RepID=A0A9Q3FFG9_9BASI|nr:hypothetical protein [Austropuccinia psidii MF-1]